MDGIIIAITIVLCMAQFILAIFVEPKIPIKLKETDTLQQIRKRKKNYVISIFILVVLTLAIFYYAMFRQSMIFGMISVFLIVFVLTGAMKIIERIEKKEKLIRGNNSFNVAMKKVKDMTLKDSITIVDEKLREAIILDDIEKTKNMYVLFKTGEKYETGLCRENLLRIMSKPYQDKIIKANIKAVSLTELEDDKFKLGVETQSGNSFSTIIEKVDLPKWIK